jgi:enoyl-CoA hydratase/carnithine racemase
MSNLIVDKQPNHWAITLNRPDKLNAFNVAIVETLIDTFDEAEARAVPLIALKGEGRCFSAGFDMSEALIQSEGDLVLRFIRIETLLQKVANSSCFTIAFAHGRNYGAGVDLIAACNLRVAAPGATFRLPGLKFGLVLGSARFARIVGTHEAQRILETAMMFNLDHACKIGFIEIVEKHERYSEVISNTIERVNSLPSESRRLLQEAIDTTQPDRDLATLVRSASKPGLRGRIEAYLHESRKF